MNGDKDATEVRASGAVAHKRKTNENGFKKMEFQRKEKKM